MSPQKTQAQVQFEERIKHCILQERQHIEVLRIGHFQMDTEKCHYQHIASQFEISFHSVLVQIRFVLNAVNVRRQELNYRC